jgi:argininosuccinate lyase
MHTGRSRNEQVAVDLRLWLRDASAEVRTAACALAADLRALAERTDLPLPGYTHLRRAMPSTVALWATAHAAALDESLAAFVPLDARLRRCPLGTGAGYGVPLPLDRALVASLLGFDGPDEPVTLTQNVRGRAELCYATALESLALDLGKLAFDLWLFTSEEFSFARLPVALTTGSSMMPQKRNPDVLELLRAECRQIVADRAALLDALRDLPSGYHRDFQTLKPPLFRAHDRATACLAIAGRVVRGLAFDPETLTRAASDPALRATERALQRAKEGVPFRDAYVAESRGAD